MAAGTPILADYNIVGLGVRIADGNPQTVTCILKVGASPGAVTVLYGESMSETAPSAAGSYAVTLRVAATAGFYAKDITAGTLEIVAPLVTMNTTSNGKVTITLWGSGETTINWGDGSATETKTLTGLHNVYSHTYTTSGEKTIHIASKGTLTSLDCYNSSITTLDVNKATMLTHLICFYNQLKNLDVAKNTVLTVLGCDGNQLESLDVSKNTVLAELRCQNNKMDAEALNTLFGHSA